MTCSCLLHQSLSVPCLYKSCNVRMVPDNAGRAVFRRIRMNFFWALGYNCLGIPIAAGALYPALRTRLPPEVAGAAMAFSSLSVISSSLWLRRYKPPRMPDMEGETAAVKQDERAPRTRGRALRGKSSGTSGYEVLDTGVESGGE